MAAYSHRPAEPPAPRAARARASLLACVSCAPAGAPRVHTTDTHDAGDEAWEGVTVSACDVARERHKYRIMKNEILFFRTDTDLGRLAECQS